MFSEHIKSVVDSVDEGIGGLVMGLDGIAVETYVRDGQSFDVNTIGMEFSFILGQVKKAGDILQLGGISEFAVQAETLTLVVRMLNDEYFLAVVLGQGTNFGKARFLMRVAESRLKPEL